MWILQLREDFTQRGGGKGGGCVLLIRDCSHPLEFPSLFTNRNSIFIFFPVVTNFRFAPTTIIP